MHESLMRAGEAGIGVLLTSPWPFPKERRRECERVHL